MKKNEIHDWVFVQMNSETGQNWFCEMTGTSSQVKKQILRFAKDDRLQLKEDGHDIVWCPKAMKDIDDQCGKLLTASLECNDFHIDYIARIKEVIEHFDLTKENTK